MDFRSRFESGDSRLPAVQKEDFDCRKLAEEEKEPLRNVALFEDEKGPDTVSQANFAESTTEAAEDLQNKVKIEEESDIGGSNASALKAADLLREPAAQKETFDGDHDLTDEKNKKTTESPLKRHLFTCPRRNCPSSFKKFKEMEDHMKTHSRELDFFCDVCKRPLFSFYGAILHFQKREKMECCDCGKKLPSVSEFTRHLHSHTGDNYTTQEMYSCKKCDVKFTRSDILEKHMKIRHQG